MRRYGTTGYGGNGNRYVPREQPQNFPDVPTGSIPPLPTPSDILPRRPDRLNEGGGNIVRIPRAAPTVEEMLARLIAATERGVYDPMRYPTTLRNVPLVVGVADQVALDRATNLRIYLFIVNTHPVNTLFLTFDDNATGTNGIPLLPLGGAFEYLFTVPQGVVHLTANAPGTTAIVTFGELVSPVAK